MTREPLGDSFLCVRGVEQISPVVRVNTGVRAKFRNICDISAPRRIIRTRDRDELITFGPVRGPG